MTTWQLVRRSLSYYWRTNLAVVLGVATAVSVLAGALLVGDSVRGSLRALVTGRLGQTDLVVLSNTFFREALATDLAGETAFAERFVAPVPLLMAQAVVTAQGSGTRVGNVAVYGVDDRFWRFHGVPDLAGPGARDTWLSPALAAELGVSSGEAVLLRVQRPSDVPLESLHSRKNGLGRSVRVTVRRVLAPVEAGEFSLRPQQGAVRAAFVSLSRLQQDLEIVGRANVLLAGLRAGAPSPEERSRAVTDLQRLVRSRAALEDVGMRVRAPGGTALAVESAAGLLDATQEAAARDGIADAGLTPRPVFTYLANTLRVGTTEVPYSLVAALDLGSIPGVVLGPASADAPPPIVLTDWAARDLGARVGDRTTLDYYVWEDPGRLITKSADFRVAAIVPLGVGDRTLAPEYPGITDSPTLDDWDPPFPVDLRRVRPQDEAFWREHRTTPKAYVPLEVGRQLWRSRYGAVTSVRATVDAGAGAGRLDDVAARVRARVDPLAVGLAVRDVRAEALAASRGATDFGEYFLYFSFFLVVSALVLTALFFKLGIEQRVKEIGLLRAVGFGARHVRLVFLLEGAVLALTGSVLGAGGALGYAWLVITGLKTWWVGAVGTTALTVYLGPGSLPGGVVGGCLAALLCVWWTLRRLSRVTERSLLAGDLVDGATLLDSGRLGSRAWPARFVPAALTLAGLALLAAGAAEVVDPAGAFFGGGAALLVATLTGVSAAMRRPSRSVLHGRGLGSVGRLGLRNVSYRPGRAVLAMAVVAAAAFILVTVGAFRRGSAASSTDPRSGVGGYAAMVTMLVPLVHDVGTEEGRQELGLTLPAGVSLEPFRVLPGDDASCLNLYAPTRPRILGARQAFIDEGRFVFQASLAHTDAERENPWRLLSRPEPDGAIPVIADANSLAYVLHTAVGGDFVIDDNGKPLRLRVVGALRDSVLQGELVMAEANFVAQFPGQQGYGLAMVQAAPGQTAAAVRAIEDALGDSGADAVLTTDRLDEFHRVENTYLSTFQTLGGLGLLLGTVGVAAVLLRNVLERRRELALLGAVGYGRRHFLLMAFVENLVLVGAGVLIGGMCAWIAVAPALAERGSPAPVGRGGLILLGGILVTGLISAMLATRATLRAPLLESLRSE